MSDDQMQIEIDEDVKAVLAFMQGRMCAPKLVPVALAVAQIAPILWGQYAAVQVLPLSLRTPSPIDQSYTQDYIDRGMPDAGDGRTQSLAPPPMMNIDGRNKDAITMFSPEFSS